MTVMYQIDFHVPIKEIQVTRNYPVESECLLTVEQLIELLAGRFSTIRLLLSYGRGSRLPVAVLVDGRALESTDVIPDGSVVKIIGAVAGGSIAV